MAHIQVVSAQQAAISYGWNQSTDDLNILLVATTGKWWIKCITYLLTLGQWSAANSSLSHSKRYHLQRPVREKFAHMPYYEKWNENGARQLQLKRTKIRLEMLDAIKTAPESDTN